MNKLSNISPFLLLLVPVFVLMVFTFARNIQQNNEAEAVVKPTIQSTSLSKITTISNR